MAGPDRREQLLSIGRATFAERGYEAATIEEIAERAGVSKPVVYGHFGDKESLYASVVDREIQTLSALMVAALQTPNPRTMLTRATEALLSYAEDEPDGFRILLRDSPFTSSSGRLGRLIGDIAGRVDAILAAEFSRRGIDAGLAPIYARALVGMVAFVGQWWLDAGSPGRDEVSKHVANLAWNGLRDLERGPGKRLAGRRIK
jgi:AcrR family transcriptional regulator